MIRSKKQLNAAASKGMFVIRTMGEGYALNDGTTVAGKLAASELQSEMFADIKLAPGAFVPQEDGLLPGFSQTWRAE